MENTVEFLTAIAEIVDETSSEFSHPLLTKIKFVFATSEGARLSTVSVAPKQGIKVEDFDEIIKTAINTPIKMRYLGSRGVGSHFGSIPIGHIIGMEKTKLEDGVDALVAEAVLYTAEYPDEVEYLKTAYAQGNSPGISYEVRHNPKKSLIENGVEWLKDVVTQAATIVKSPAYGSRTAIMALASNREIPDDEFNSELLTIIKPKDTTNKGGTNMDEKDQKIKDLETQLVALAAEKGTAETSVASLTTELSTANDAIKTLTEELNGLKRSQLLDQRSKAYTEAGLSFDQDTAKASEKQELLANMSDEVFTAYIADMKVLADKAATALASSSNGNPRVPRLAVSAGEGEMSLDDLKSKIRGISRN